jgi:hypothetical protein
LAEAQQQKMITGNTQKNEKMADEQQAIKSGTEELANKIAQLSKQQSGRPSAEKAREYLNQAVREQQQAEESLRNNTPEQAKKNQEKAVAEMGQALNNLNQQHEQQEKQNSRQGQKHDQQANSQPEPARAETDQPESGAEERPDQVPLNQTAQGILDEEMENRKARKRNNITGFQPVEKDW